MYVYRKIVVRTMFECVRLKTTTEGQQQQEFFFSMNF